MPLTHPYQHKNPHKYDCNTETKYRRIPRVHEVPSGIPGVSLGTAPAKIPVFAPKSGAARRRLGKELWVCENGL
ncbi:hypothetical protein FYZ45_10735 [Mobiluncus mulieris]|uniref:Uncharacterized protein n=1 Tax=Mobiluncus mulieris TaxID=2052 RepID=A0ABD4U0F5_9ACTO|nr:hypothetical protein [Mobiluncus mulieris]MCU9974216.1 hypothetical protein [Mobiluncus mulieris]MCU9994390.1 hypothetical protein [Mobiluncus mulieris]MCV0010372.1 hypothetical protein [Mobiluncus mulieris]